MASVGDVAAGLVLSLLTLRATFRLQACSRVHRECVLGAGGAQVVWNRLAEFTSLPPFLCCSSAACCLHEWASLKLRQVVPQASQLPLSALGFEADVDDRNETVHAISLDPGLAMAVARKCLLSAQFEGDASIGRAAAKLANAPTADNGAEFRCCSCRSECFASPSSAGYTNVYEAEVVLPLDFVSHTCVHLRAEKYHTDDELGWDEGFKVTCRLDGRTLFEYLVDGCDSEYDAQSVSSGLVEHASKHLLAPVADVPATLHVLWRVLCAPTLAWPTSPEGGPRRAEFELPQRECSHSSLFLRLGDVFTDLANTAARGEPVDHLRRCDVSSSSLDDELRAEQWARYLSGH